MEGLFALLNNGGVLTLIVAAWGLAVRFAPQLKGWPSMVIPYGNFIIALLVKLAAPTEANAAGVDSVAATLAGGEVSFWSKMVAAAIQALLNSLLYDKFLKAPAVKTLGTTKEKKASLGAG